MKALRLKLFQETACYRKPFAFKVGETYPLPPHSTVKGMLHALIAATEFIPMRLSIQGNYETIMIDYQTHYFMKKNEMTEFPLVLDGLGIAYSFENMTTMPLYTHLLYQVELLIHVEAEMPILERIITAIESGEQTISLGRWEDLVRVDEYKLVKVNALTGEVNCQYPAFVRYEDLHPETARIPYRLNWKYSIFNGVRKWEKVHVGYVHPGSTFEAGEALQDEDGELVFYHLPEGEE